MNKELFLRLLSEELSGIPAAEREKQLACYRELLDDMTEEGMSEEGAVAQLGAPSAVAAEILRNAPKGAAGTEPVQPRDYSRVWKVILITAACIIGLALVLVIGKVTMGAVIFSNLTDETTLVSVAVVQKEPGDGWHTMPESGSLSLDGEGLENLKLDWAAGSIEIVPGEGEEIRLSESAARELTGKNRLQWRMDGDTLSLRYSMKWGRNAPAKDLHIELPPAMWNKMELNTVASRLDIRGLEAEELKVAAVSGKTVITGVNIKDAQIETVSGALELQGSWDSLKTDSVSGETVLADCEIRRLDMEAVTGRLRTRLLNTPEKLEAETVSGAVELTVPAESGFTVEFETVSGKLRSDDFAMTRNGNTHRAGDGLSRWDIETVSGDLTVSAGN